jgi:hypothetical protein
VRPPTFANHLNIARRWQMLAASSTPAAATATRGLASSSKQAHRGIGRTLADRRRNPFRSRFIHNCGLIPRFCESPVR